LGGGKISSPLSSFLSKIGAYKTMPFLSGSFTKNFKSQHKRRGVGKGKASRNIQRVSASVFSGSLHEVKVLGFFRLKRAGRPSPSSDIPRTLGRAKPRAGGHWGLVRRTKALGGPALEPRVFSEPIPEFWEDATRNLSEP
jgi:hypothetical protein